MSGFDAEAFFRTFAVGFYKASGKIVGIAEVVEAAYAQGRKDVVAEAVAEAKPWEAVKHEEF